MAIILAELEKQRQAFRQYEEHRESVIPAAKQTITKTAAAASDNKSEKKSFTDKWMDRRKATELAEPDNAHNQPTAAEEFEKARQEANRKRLTEQLAAAGIAVDAGIDKLDELGKAKASRSQANNQPFAVDDAYKTQVGQAVQQAVTPEQKNAMQIYAEEAELTRAYLDARTQQERQEIYARLLALQQQKPTHARVMDRIGGAVGGGILQLEAGVTKAVNPADRDGAADRVLQNVEEANVRGKLGLGAVGGVVYDAAQMLANNAAALGVGGLAGAAAKGVTLGLMGTAAGGQSIREAQQAGADDAQAMAAGIANAVAEMAFEYLPLDNLFKLAKGDAKTVIRNNLGTYVAAMAKQAGIEAGTEAATTVAQNVTDLMFYEKELHPDMDMGKWWQNTGSEALYSALLGGIVGGAMGAPAAVAGVRAQQGDTVPVGGAAGGTGGDGDARKGINENNAVSDKQNGEVEQVAAVEVNEAQRAANEPLAGDYGQQDEHTPEELQVMTEYQAAVDSKLLGFVQKVISKAADIPKRFELKGVSNRAAEDIRRLTGVDTHGFRTAIEPRAVQHIVNRHGANGQADQTMADSADIARIQYVLDNYDNVEYSGRSEAYTTNENGRSKTAKTVTFTKKIDGHYYVVEAVPDTKAKTAYVVSAYKNRSLQPVSGQAPALRPKTQHTNAPVSNSRAVTQVSDAVITAPNGTSETSLPSPNPTFNNNIPNSAEYVKAGEFGVQGAESAADGQTPDERENEARRGINQSLSAEQQRAAEVARRLGVRLRVQNPGGGRSGQYADGVITISPDAEQPVRQVLVHELTHHIESSGYYAALADHVERYIKGRMKLDAEAMQRDLAAEYAAAGVELNEDGARRELVAKFCEQMLFTDEAAIERLANTEQSLFRKIYGWVRDMLARLRGTAAEAELRRIEKLYIKAAHSTVSEAGSEVQYSIIRDADGKVFVDVDTDILDGVPEKDIPRVLSDIVQNKFHNLIEANGQQVGVNQKTAKEWRFSKEAQKLYNVDKQSYDDKIRAFDKADELLTASRDYIGEKAKHHNYKEFARGKVDFRVGANDYSADVVVGISGSGRAYLYDLVNIIQKKTADTLYNQPSFRKTGSNASAVKAAEVVLSSKNISDTKTIGRTSATNDSINDSGQKSNGDINKIYLQPAAASHRSTTGGLTAANTGLLNNNIPNSAEYVMAGEFGVQGAESTADGQTPAQRENEARKGANQSLRAEQQRAAEVARRLGVRLRVQNPGGGRSGQYADGVITISPDAAEPVRQVLVHELTHHIESSRFYGEYAGMVLRDFEQELGGGNALQEYRGKLRRAYAANGVELTTDAEVDAEIVAIRTEELFDEAAVDRLARLNRGIVERVYQWFRDIYVKLRGTEEQKYIVRLLQAYEKALRTTGHRGNGGQAQYRINSSFAGEIDAWDGKSYIAFNVGTTSEALQSIGVDDRKIIWHSSKIKNILEKHSGMTRDIIKQVPEILEHPIAVLKSQQSESRIAIFGEVRDVNSDPVLAVLELEPAKQSGKLLNLNIIASAYGKDSNPAGFVRNSEVLYLDPNKKRTDKWMQSFRLQLPSGVITYGSMGSITYQDGEVKIVGTPFAQLMQNGGKDTGDSGQSSLGFSTRDIMEGRTTPRRRTELTPDEVQRELESARDKYGVIPAGMKPRREGRTEEVPSETKHGKTRQFVRTAYESPTTPLPVVDALQQEIVEGSFAYQPTANARQVEDAKSEIALRGGIKGGLEKWRALAKSGKQLSAKEIVLGEQLLADVCESGDYDTAVELVQDLAIAATEAGRSVQAFAVLKRMTPAGKAVYMQKCVDRINMDYEKQILKGKMRPVGISQENIERLAAAQTPEEAREAEAVITEEIARQLPSSAGEMINAWRYLAMLGNARTHIRNISGNIVMTLVREPSGQLAAGMEAIVAGIQKRRGKEFKRTRAAGLAPKEYREFARADYARIAEQVTAGGKYDFRSDLEERKRIFRANNPLANRIMLLPEWLRKTNSSLLEKEDAFFMQAAYANALAGYMKANELTPEFLRSGTKQANKALAEARNFASLQAQKVTFRTASRLATWLNRLERQNAAAKIGVGGLLPFRRTPINILKTGLEYSPMGIMQGIWKALVSVRRGTATANEAIEKLANGMTGTGICLLGAYLASQGLLRAEGEDEDKVEYWQQEQGVQQYALVIGDHSYTIDWLAPSVMPLFVGTEFYELCHRAVEEERELGLHNIVPQLLDALGTISDPLMETSMLSGVDSALTQYGENKAGGFAVTAFKNYVSQFVPTLLGQIARTVDPAVRSTYAPADSALTKGGERFGRQMRNKIPGASKLNEVSVDIWGREKSRGENPIIRAMENMLSPGYYSRKEETAVDRVINEVWQATGDIGAIPVSQDGCVTYDKKIYNLSVSEYAEYRKNWGRTAYGTIDELRRLDYFADASPELQAELIQDAYTYAGYAAEKSFFADREIHYAPKEWSAKAARSGLSAAEYICMRDKITGVKLDMDEFVEEGLSKGIDANVWVKYKKFCNSARADKDANGNSISGSKKQKVYDYIMGMDVSAKQREYLYGLVYDSWPSGEKLPGR